MPAGIGYHINILKINAVFSVAALINMLLMLNIREKIYKKIRGNRYFKGKKLHNWTMYLEAFQYLYQQYGA